MMNDGRRSVLRRGAVAPLHPRARIVRGLLERALGDGVALQTHGQSRRVHHDEHVFEAAIGLADQIADGAFALTE